MNASIHTSLHPSLLYLPEPQKLSGSRDRLFTVPSGKPSLRVQLLVATIPNLCLYFQTGSHHRRITGSGHDSGHSVPSHSPNETCDAAKSQLGNGSEPKPKQELHEQSESRHKRTKHQGIPNVFIPRYDSSQHTRHTEIRKCTEFRQYLHRHT